MPNPKRGTRGASSGRPRAGSEKGRARKSGAAAKRKPARSLSPLGSASPAPTTPCRSPHNLHDLSETPFPNLGANIKVFPTGSAVDASTAAADAFCSRSAPGTPAVVNFISVTDPVCDDPDGPSAVSLLLDTYTAFTKKYSVSQVTATAYDVSGRTLEKAFDMQASGGGISMARRSTRMLRPTQSCLDRLFPLPDSGDAGEESSALPSEDLFDCIPPSVRGAPACPRVEWGSEQGASVVASNGWCAGAGVALQLSEARNVTSAQGLANFVLQKVSQFDVTHQVGEAAGGVVDPDIVQLKQDLAGEQSDGEADDDDDDDDAFPSRRRKTIAVGRDTAALPTAEKPKKKKEAPRPKVPPPRDDLCQVLRLKLHYTTGEKDDGHGKPRRQRDKPQLACATLQCVRLFTSDTASRMPGTLHRALCLKPPADGLNDSSCFRGLVAYRDEAHRLDAGLLLLADIHLPDTLSVVVAPTHEAVSEATPSEVLDTESVEEIVVSPQHTDPMEFSSATVPHAESIFSPSILRSTVGTDSCSLTREQLDSAVDRALPDDEAVSMDGSVDLATFPTKPSVVRVSPRPSRRVDTGPPVPPCLGMPEVNLVLSSRERTVHDQVVRLVKSLKDQASVVRASTLPTLRKSFCDDPSVAPFVRLAASHPGSRAAFHTAAADLFAAALAEGSMEVENFGLRLTDSRPAVCPRDVPHLYRRAVVHWDKHGFGHPSGRGGGAGEVGGTYVMIGNRRINVLDELLKERKVKEELLREKRDSDEQKSMLIADLRRARESVVERLETARGDASNTTFQNEQLNRRIEMLAAEKKELAQEHGRLTHSRDKVQREAAVEIDSLRDELAHTRKAREETRQRAEAASREVIEQADVIRKLRRSLDESAAALKQKDVSAGQSHSNYDMLMMELKGTCADKSNTITRLEKDNKALRDAANRPRDPARDPLFIQLAGDVRKQHTELCTAASEHQQQVHDLQSAMDLRDIEHRAEVSREKQGSKALQRQHEEEAATWEKERSALRLAALAQEHKRTSQEEKWRRDKAVLLQKLAEGRNLIGALVDQETQGERAVGLNELHDFLERHQLHMLLPILRAHGCHSLPQAQQLSHEGLREMHLDDTVQKRLLGALATLPTPPPPPIGSALQAWVDTLRHRFTDPRTSQPEHSASQRGYTRDIPDDDEESCEPLSPQAFNTLLWGKTEEDKRLAQATSRIKRGNEFQLL